MAGGGGGVDSQFGRGLDRVELWLRRRQGNGCNPAQTRRSARVSRCWVGSTQAVRWRPVRGAVVVLPQNLMHPLSCKPIASVPKLANRTPLGLVIDALLVRTANYAIADRDGSHLMLFDKFENLAGNAGIATNVATIHYQGRNSLSSAFSVGPIPRA